MGKKIIAFTLTAMLILSFAGCGNNENIVSYNASASETVNKESDETSAVIGTSEKVSQNGDVLVDNEYCQIIFNGLEYIEDDIRMNLSVQNKMDKEFGITIDDFAMNGIMSGISNECNIGTNQKTDIICFIGYDYHTISCGIENRDISIVEFGIKIWDPQTYENFYEETHVVYPLGEDAAQKKEYISATTDVVMLDNDVCTISFIKGDKEESAYYLYLYIENKTDKTISFEFPKGKVNGVPTSVTDSIPKITAKNAMYYTPSLWNLEEDGISEVKTIELPVLAYSWDNFAEPIVDETFTITP